MYETDTEEVESGWDDQEQEEYEQDESEAQEQEYEDGEADIPADGIRRQMYETRQRTLQVWSPRQYGIVAQETTLQPKEDATPPKPWRSSIEVVNAAQQDIVWLIPGFLPAGAVVLLSGREGSMKSWLAMTMARAVAAGGPWLEKPTRQGAVLYLDGEMPPAVLQDRLRGIGPVEGWHIWGWTDPMFPSQLDDNLSLDEAARCHTLIVVDTLRRQMKGRKENSSDDMAEITTALRELTRYGAAVLALHHAPKDVEKVGYRGSTELGAGVDITLSLTKKRTNGKDSLILQTHKTRYSSSDDFTIQVTKGERAPVLSIGSENHDDDTTRELMTLGLVIQGQREDLGHDPIQSDILAKAKEIKLGGKDKILRLLEEGEGSHWESEQVGNRKHYKLFVDLSDRS